MWYEWGLNPEHVETFLYVVGVGFEPRAGRDFPICGTSGFGPRAWRDFSICGTSGVWTESMERLSHMWYAWGLNLEHEETFRYAVQVGLEPRAWRDFPICGMGGV